MFTYEKVVRSFPFGNAVFTSSPAATLFSTNAVWRYFKGTNEASSPDATAWRAPAFDDSAWSNGLAPFYYDTDTSASGDTGNTQLTDMQGGYTCIFLRTTFVVTNAAVFSALQIAALSDDGFIAWINGVEVARFNMPDGEPAYNGVASGALTEPIPVQNFALASPGEFLVPGANVITVQAFNVSLAGSSDFVIWLTLDGSPATNLTAYTAAQYFFEFPQPPTGTVQIAWAPGHVITDLAGNNFLGGGWTYLLDPNAPVPEIQISEFMAENLTSITDEDGDHSDWIELLNPTDDNLNSMIRYTLDGSPPTETSLPYTNAFTVSTSRQVRARAFAPRLFPDAIYSERAIFRSAPAWPQPTQICLRC